jgi:hypothetical protein
VALTQRTVAIFPTNVVNVRILFHSNGLTFEKSAHFFWGLTLIIKTLAFILEGDGGPLYFIPCDAQAQSALASGTSVSGRQIGTIMHNSTPPF